MFEAGPRSLALAGTVGLEHLTAALGHVLLIHPLLMATSEPHFAALWTWHAAEETEHKAVCFDVYTRAYGTGRGAYLLRVSAFVIAVAIFLAIFMPTFIYMVAGAGALFDVAGWLRLYRLHWGSGQGRGILLGIMPLLKSFFSWDFHPWQHDNESLLRGAPIAPPGMSERRRRGDGGKRASSRHVS